MRFLRRQPDIGPDGQEQQTSDERQRNNGKNKCLESCGNGNIAAQSRERRARQVREREINAPFRALLFFIDMAREDRHISREGERGKNAVQELNEIQLERRLNNKVEKRNEGHENGKDEHQPKIILFARYGVNQMRDGNLENAFGEEIDTGGESGDRLIPALNEIRDEERKNRTQKPRCPHKDRIGNDEESDDRIDVLQKIVLEFGRPVIHKEIISKKQKTRLSGPDAGTMSGS